MFDTYHLLSSLFNFILLPYLDVCYEIIFVYDQPMELVFQGCRSLNNGSERVRTDAVKLG